MTNETMTEILTDDAYEKPATIPAKPHWSQKRIDQLTAEKHVAKTRIEELEQELNAMRGKTISQEGLDHIILDLAAQRDFEQRCNQIHAQGMETYPDFDLFVENIGQKGGLTPDVVDVILHSDQAIELIAHLGENPNLVAALNKKPAHLQIAEIVRLERKIENENSQKPTIAPEPIGNLAAVTIADTGPSDTDDAKTWVKKRKAQIIKK